MASRSGHLRKNKTSCGITQTALPSIVASEIVSCKFAFPPHDEQRRIVDFLDNKTRASIKEYKKLKQAIITHAVTKGIRPNRTLKDSSIEQIGQIPDKTQWMYNRDPREVCFQFNKRILGQFAVDHLEVWMTTELAGKNTYFLPFNKGSNGAGRDGGKGNPSNPHGYPTAYLWEQVFQKDSMIDILQKFLHLQITEEKKSLDEIMKKINEQYKGNFTDADKVLVMTLRTKLMNNTKLQTMAKTSDPQIFTESIFPKAFGTTAQDSYIKSQDTFTTLFEDQAKCNAIMHALSNIIYREMQIMY